MISKEGAARVLEGVRKGLNQEFVDRRSYFPADPVIMYNESGKVEVEDLRETKEGYGVMLRLPSAFNKKSEDDDHPELVEGKRIKETLEAIERYRYFGKVSLSFSAEEKSYIFVEVKD